MQRLAYTTVNEGLYIGVKKEVFYVKQILNLFYLNLIKPIAINKGERDGNHEN